MAAARASIDAMIARMEVMAARAKVLLLGMGGAVAGLVYMFSKQEEAEKKLESVIRSTGHAAGFSAKELKKMAGELQTMTKYEDDAIINGQALLATFVNIKGDTFKRATSAMLDMASVMGGDLKSAAIQLGKALNDPVVGAAALRRVGVSLSKQQMDMIKHFMDLNDIASAQKIVLDELAVEFGGAAVAMAEGSGKVRQLLNELGDLGDQLGKVLLPVAIGFLQLVNAVITPIAKWAEAHATLTAVMVTTAAVLLSSMVLLPKVVAAWTLMVNVLSLAKTAFIGVNVAIATMGPVMQFLTGTVIKLRWALMGLVATPLGIIVTAIVATVAALGGLWLWTKQIEKEQEKSAQTAKVYSDKLKEIGAAAKKVRESKGDAELIAALKERIRLEEEAMALADETKAAVHQRNMDRLMAEKQALESKIQVETEAAQQLRQNFENELASAELAAQQAGKEKLEKERLTLIAKGYNEQQIAHLMQLKQLAIEREAAAEAEQAKREKEKQFLEELTNKVISLRKELFKLRGGNDEAIELFDLANAGATAAQLDKVAQLMGQVAQEEAKKQIEEIRKSQQEQLKNEKRITAEKEAQAAASAAGRFADLQGMWKDIQSAAIKAPLQREAETIRQQNRIRETADRIQKIQDEALKKLNNIWDTLKKIADKKGPVFSA